MSRGEFVGEKSGKTKKGSETRERFSEEKLSKNYSGENAHMPLCVLTVLWSDVSTVIKERD